jgi:hypothetical protein
MAPVNMSVDAGHMKISFVEARKGNQGKKIDLDTVSAVRGLSPFTSMWDVMRSRSAPMTSLLRPWTTPCRPTHEEETWPPRGRRPLTYGAIRFSKNDG